MQKRLHLSDDHSKENLPPEKKSWNGMCPAGTPAYWAYKRRLKHRLESLGPASESVCVIDVEATDVPVPDSEPVVITVETEQLTKSDLDILEDRSKWLNCKLINAGQFLMRDSQPCRVYMMSHSPELFRFHPMIDLLYRFSTAPKATGFVLPTSDANPTV